jgi:predicted NBD/HSP70 family sugar kinase
VPLKEQISRRFGLATWLENDANAMAVSEKHYGKHADCEHLICIKLGDGVGGGIVANGALLRGNIGGAGEFGSMMVDLSRGSEDEGITRSLSWPSIYARVVYEISRGRRSAMEVLAGGDIRAITPAVWITALEQGDALAVEIMEKVANVLGYLVVNLVNIFNPQAVLFSSPLMNGSELMLARVRSIVVERCWKSVADPLRIDFSSFGDDFELVGAAAVALQDIFHFQV